MKITQLIKICLLIFTSLLFTSACSADNTSGEIAKTIDPIKKDMAIELIKQMNSGDFDKATLHFNEKMKSALPAKQLKSVWNQINNQAGNFQSILNTTQKMQGTNTTVYVTSQFENTILDVKVSFDQDNKIIGLFFSPSKYKAKNSSAKTKTKEKETNNNSKTIQFGDKDWLLDGEIRYPKTGNNFPLVILVHGSGPHDMDSTIGPNKPFRDIAEQLAKKGVASLRYNKRTKQHASQYAENTALLQSLTINEETVHDAIHAYNYAKTAGRINPNKVFIAGISQGGMMMPRIAQQTDAAGYIMLAAPARSLEVLILEQYNYIMGLDGEISNQEAKAINALKTQIDTLSNLTIDSTVTNKDLPMGLSKTYWLDLMNYDMVEEAKKIDNPLLIIQGGRDYQVLADKDFKIWQDTFKQADHVTLELLPSLNHLMVAGDKPSVPDEYFIPASIDNNFINLLSTWILDH